MKRITAVALFTLACILSVSSAFAQVQRVAVEVTVPFDFMVGNRQLPAGTYSIVRTVDEIIQIRNLRTKVVAVTLASEDGGSSAGCVLDFDKHARQNFLHAVRCQSASISINLPVSKLEQTTRVEEAKLHESGGQVVIAAR